MRLVLALLAVLALLVQPVTAAAAQSACAEGATAMTGMAMPAATDSVHAGGPQASAPCCDHSRHKADSRGCAQACAAGCAVAIALPSGNVGFSGAYSRAPLAVAREASVLSFRPPGPERPPKSMA